MFKGMVPPGLFQATCVSGAPTGPNRVLQGQRKENEGQEKKELLYHIYIYIYIYIYIHIRGAHTCALYEVAKHALVDEVRLLIFVCGLCRGRVVLAHVAKHARGLFFQLFD